MSEQRERRTLRATALSTALSYAAQVLSLVAIPLFLQTVGAEAYGLMVTVMAFMGYLNFADAGLSWGSMILIAHANGRKARLEIAQIVRHSAALAAVSGLLVGVGLVGVLTAAKLGWRLPMFNQHPASDRLLVVAGIHLVITLQFGVIYNVFQGLQENAWAGLYQGLGRLVGLCGGMFAAWWSHDIAWVMIAQLLGAAVMGLAALIHLKQRHPWALTMGSFSDRGQYRALLGVGGRNFMLQVGRTLQGTAPTLAISSVLGAAAVPFYTVPLTLLSTFFTPINVWSAMAQSAYGEAWTAGDRAWIRSAFRQSWERALLLGGLGVGLFFGLANTFVRLWTHGRLWVELPAAASVAAVVLTGAALGLGQYLLTALGRNGRVAAAEIGNGVVALVLVPLAVGRVGFGGVGLGIVVAVLCTSGWVMVKEITANLGRDWSPELHFVARLVVAAVAAAVAARAVIELFFVRSSAEEVVRLIGAGLVGVGAFLAVALVLRLPMVNELLRWPDKLRAAAIRSRNEPLAPPLPRDLVQR